MANRNFLAVLVFIMLGLIWGSTWMFIKIGLEDAPPFLSAGLRFLVASLLLFPYVRLKGLKIPRDRQTLSIMIFTGLFAVSVSYGLVYWSEQYISSGLTAVLFSSFPFFVIIFSHIMIADDRLSVTKIIGATIGFTGVTAIFLDNLKIENPKALFATSAVILSARSAALSDVVIKKNSKSLNPATLTLVHMLCGTAVFLIIGLVFENINNFNITMKSIGSIFYLAILGSSIAFIAFYWLISQIKVTKASLIIFVIPIVALFLDWLVMEQTLNWRVFAGSGLVITGIGIASR
jgi:drug/metabolite transporter (DMT)-like permease